MDGDEQRGPRPIPPLFSHVLTIHQSVQPTTTLQALVNLKRPTLKLSPLQAHPSDDSPDDLNNVESHNNHALEFEYDCDAPKCCIKVQVIIPSKEPNSNGNSHPISERIIVYESVFDGGFGRLLKLEDGATIDLDRFQHPAAHSGRVVGVDRSSPNLDKNLIAAEMSEHLEVPSQSNTPVPDQQDNGRKRRFTGIYFRRRSHNVSGPALAVVDDAAAATESGEKERGVLDDDGVRVAIQLVALDDFGKELSSVNRQSTYLHVVRLGPPVTSGEDNRSWVVKVVKREAMASAFRFIDARLRLTWSCTDWPPHILSARNLRAFILCSAHSVRYRPHVSTYS